MQKIYLIFCTSIILSPCFAQETTHKTLIPEAYSSYNNSNLSPSIAISTQKTNYDSIIYLTIDRIGLAGSDIEIDKTNEYGAFSVFNRSSLRRFLVYSPFFFDSVYSVTKTNYGIMSICFHELAHHLFNHTLKPNNMSIICEKQADWYSGYQMCIIGATLEQSLIAMKDFGNDLETSTHPDKASRLIEIEKGYTTAKINIFKDSSYLKKDSVFKTNELLFALKKINPVYEILSYNLNDSISSATEKPISKPKKKQLYSLYGELIYFNSDKKIKLFSNDKTIGNLAQSKKSLTTKILNLDGVKFYLENDKDIFSISPDGSKLEAGKKIIN